MGAVKNVGEGPVKLIMDARKEDKFKDLNDFIRRVDLRQAGKRTLECLIRVGALDEFGPRKALLEVMDSIVSVSSSHFRAVQAGQMSFFGTVSGVEESLTLPTVSSLDPREQLEWEKELMGLYVSDHPLSPYLPLLRIKVTHFSSELGDESAKGRVTVAGLVTKMRTLTTKNGKQMAFATIEDLEGPIELVIFPNTWTKYGRLVHTDSILLAEGKVDDQSTDPKVLVDSLQELSVDDLQNLPSTGKEDEHQPSPTSQVRAEPRHPASSYDPADDEPPMPPEPDDWILADPPINSDPSLSSTDYEAPVDEPVAHKETLATVAIAPSAAVQTIPAEVQLSDSIGPMPLLILSPHLYDSSRAAEKGETHMVTVILHATGEKDRDIRRLKHVHGLLRSCPGNDHFCFYIFENGYRHFLDFPNDSTRVNSQMLDRLVELVGNENVQIETIKFQ
jgi:DNA polymerase-3 subunit alpha